MRSARKPESGITLLEMLLSLAVMAMIGVGIGSLFQTGNQVWARVNDNKSLADEAVVRTELRTQMEEMLTVSPEYPLDELFRWQPNGFSFWRTEHWRDVLSNEGRLIITDQSNGVTQTARSEVARASVTYFGRKTVRDEATWHVDWQDASILPQLIKIESWSDDGTAYAPLAIQPGKITRQMEISLSSLVPPD